MRVLVKNVRGLGQGLRSLTRETLPPPPPQQKQTYTRIYIYIYIYTYIHIYIYIHVLIAEEETSFLSSHMINPKTETLGPKGFRV